MAGPGRPGPARKTLAELESAGSIKARYPDRQTGEVRSEAWEPKKTGVPRRPHGLSTYCIRQWKRLCEELGPDGENILTPSDGQELPARAVPQNSTLATPSGI